MKPKPRFKITGINKHGRRVSVLTNVPQIFDTEKLTIWMLKANGHYTKLGITKDVTACERLSTMNRVRLFKDRVKAKFGC